MTGQQNCLFDSVMMDICNYTSVKTQRMYNTKSEF